MNAVMPVYYQIKQTIRQWIINKEFRSGEKIPSENHIAEIFGVSRVTVRQAISHLIQEGFLDVQKGEGTFVTKNVDLIDSFSFEFSGFIDDVLHQLPGFRTKSVEIFKTVAPRHVAEKLELTSENREVVQINRVRLFRDRFLTYSVNSLPLEIGLKVRESDLYERRLLEILSQDLKIQFTEAVQTVEALFASQEVAEKIGVASGSPVLFVERIMYTKKRKPVELFQSTYRGDLHKFIVRFKNVRRKDGQEWVHSFNKRTY